MESGMLAGKVVVITGAGRGIGAACARGVARQGAAVVVNDLDADVAEDTATSIVSNGGEAISCVADVSDWAQAGRLIGSCIESFGRIDGLVNNAALYSIGKVDEFDPNVARALVEVNILGPMYCTAHAVKLMLAQGGGSIVNVVSGAHLGLPGMGVYGATKGAVASLVYNWAMELAGTGVRVNALSPFGATDILENSNRYLRQRFAGNVRTSKAPDRTVEIQPADANSPIVEYLLSDDAADVNGQLVRIDKGEISLYAHPALLLPAVKRESWDARAVAEVFAKDLKHRQVPCGVLGTEHLPVELASGHWKRAAEPAQGKAGPSTP
jgi:NAD(P)-dependent dehydrogenase (short-subunit alcohol dehydrogenase family)